MKKKIMNQELWTAVDNYISDLFIPSDPILERALKVSDAVGLPGYNVSPTQGKLLQILAQIQGAKNILEIGTLGGYSTIWLARALPAKGHLLSLEVNPKHVKIARDNIKRAGLSYKVKVRLGKALDTLPKLVAEGCNPFDLIFIDADKENSSAYFSWALKLSRPGSLIIIDNVIRHGEIINTKSDDNGVQAIRRLNELLAAKPNVNVIEIQIVGIKGYDGFAIVRVNKVT
jgi:predicted O-methyltransferase YrrM